MVEPIKILNGLRTAEQRVSDLKHGLELADRLANVDDRMAHLQKLIDTEGRVERFTKKYGKVTVEGRRQQQRSNRSKAPAS